MKKLLLLLWIIPCLVFGQGKTISFQKNMMIFNGQQSSYFIDTSSTSQAKSGQLTLNGGLVIGTSATGIDFTGTYTGNAIDLSNITIDYTGSSGPAPFRIGTYASPLANSDEDQSGLLRLYTTTDAGGTSYDRGVFVCTKTTNTKGVFPVAGLAEVNAVPSGAGPNKVQAGQFIAHLNSGTAKLAIMGGDATAGMYGSWNKVASNVGAVAASGSRVAATWLDNQMNGTTSGEEYAAFITSGASPDAVFGFETTGSGWGQLFYFDETAYDQPPVSNTTLKVLVNATQYYIPLSTSNTSFTWGYPMDITGTVAVTGKQQ